MGSRMAMNLQRAGHKLTVFNRTKNKASELIDKGAEWVESPGEAAAEADVLISMLSTPEVVEGLATAENGLLSTMKKGSIWLNCSTVNPSFAKHIGAKAAAAGIHYLDAPVAGTKAPAEKGELVFLVGGSEESLSSVSGLLDIMGKKTIYLGEVGNGSNMKMLINLLLAQSMLAFSEALVLGEEMGLDQDTLFNVLLNTPVTAPFLSLVRPKLENRDYEANFPLQWMQKDIHLATTTAYELGVPMPSLNTAKEVYAQAKQRGSADLDFSSVYEFLKMRSK